jgi:hypothetical protein
VVGRAHGGDVRGSSRSGQLVMEKGVRPAKGLWGPLGGASIGQT